MFKRRKRRSRWRPPRHYHRRTPNMHRIVTRLSRPRYVEALPFNAREYYRPPPEDLRANPEGRPPLALPPSSPPFFCPGETASRYAFPVVFSRSTISVFDPISGSVCSQKRSAIPESGGIHTLCINGETNLVYVTHSHTQSEGGRVVVSNLDSGKVGYFGREFFNFRPSRVESTVLPASDGAFRLVTCCPRYLHPHAHSDLEISETDTVTDGSEGSLSSVFLWNVNSMAECKSSREREGVNLPVRLSVTDGCARRKALNVIAGNDPLIAPSLFFRLVEVDDRGKAKHNGAWEVCLWDLVEGRQKAVLDPKCRFVYNRAAFAFGNSNCPHFLMGSNYGVQVRSSSTFEKLFEIKSGPNCRSSCVSLYVDDAFGVLVGGTSGSLQLNDLRKPSACVWRFPMLKQNIPVESIECLDSSNFLVCGTNILISDSVSWGTPWKPRTRHTRMGVKDPIIAVTAPRIRVSGDTATSTLATVGVEFDEDDLDRFFELVDGLPDPAMLLPNRIDVMDELSGLRLKSIRCSFTLMGLKSETDVVTISMFEETSDLLEESGFLQLCGSWKRIAPITKDEVEAYVDLFEKLGLQQHAEALRTDLEDLCVGEILIPDRLSVVCRGARHNLSLEDFTPTVVFVGTDLKRVSAFLEIFCIRCQFFRSLVSFRGEEFESWRESGEIHLKNLSGDAILALAQLLYTDTLPKCSLRALCEIREWLEIVPIPSAIQFVGDEILENARLHLPEFASCAAVPPDCSLEDFLRPHAEEVATNISSNLDHFLKLAERDEADPEIEEMRQRVLQRIEELEGLQALGSSDELRQLVDGIPSEPVSCCSVFKVDEGS